MALLHIETLFLLVSCLVSSSYSTDEQTLLVKPSGFFSDCPEPCMMLTDYIRQRNGSTFSSSTTLMFLEGYHELEMNFLASDVTNIFLKVIPNANVSIDCGGKSKLVFSNVSNLVIENIRFVSCGVFDYQPGILLRDVNGRLTNISIMNSNATALQIEKSSIDITDLVIMQNHINQADGILLIDQSEINLLGEITISQNSALPSSDKNLSCGPKLEGRSLRRVIVLVVNTSILANGMLSAVENISPTGIVRFEQSKFVMNGRSLLYRNKVCINGALALIDTSFTITGNLDSFENLGSTYYTPGFPSTGSLYLLDSSLEVNGNLIFFHNFADVTSIECSNSNINVIGALFNVNNNVSYSYSGIILRPESFMTVNGSLTSRNNLVYNSVIRLEDSTLLTYQSAEFVNNMGARSLQIRFRSNLTMNGVIVFFNNSGVLHSVTSFNVIEGNATFILNNQRDLYNEAAVFLIESFLTLKGSYLFQGNRESTSGGAIYGLTSTVTFGGQGRFVDNSARYGGVLYLQSVPKIQLLTGTKLSFEHNMAEQGAVIYVSALIRDVLCGDSIGLNRSLCFIDSGEQYELTLGNNTAANGGSLLHIKFQDDYNTLDILTNETNPDILMESQNSGNSDPLIAADSFRLCFCENDIPLCQTAELTPRVSRGERFTISVAAVTIFGNDIRRLVHSYFKKQSVVNGKSLDGDFQHITSNRCSELEYRVFSTGDKEEIEIAADTTCDQSPLVVHCLTFNVTLEDCPKGFKLSSDQCICDEAIIMYVDSCDIDTGALSKGRENVWIGAHLDTNDSYLGLILYEDCPFDYCIPPPANVTLLDPDGQCNNNRSGILCGGCESNLSLGLANSKCLNCPNHSFLTLIIPIALLGIALICFLFVTQLTVASGAVNGLILYANILGSYEVIFQLQETYGLRIFIAWINLDFGIETCFHDGMNQLGYTVWQFAFPLYLWLLVASVIILCHFSIKASKFFGNSDPVAVLATVILLSYNKLLKNIITTLSPAHLQYPPNSTNVDNLVWLYDGNVAFGQGGHAVLMVIALLVLLFLFLPYTLVLVLAQFLQRNTRISKCFNKLNLTHSIKSYHVPYKLPNRYWIGLCLLLRCVLHIILVTSENESANLLAISSISIVLLSIIGIAGGIHSSRWLDVLEISFILNLAVLSVATYHVRVAGGIQVAATYISTFIAFVTFLGIVAVFIYRQLMKLEQFRKVINTIKNKKNNEVELESNFNHDSWQKGKVTSQVVYLSQSDRQSELSQSDRQSELRESLLDDDN